MIEVVSIDDVLSNPDNPRVIRDDKFKKLVRSIREFPKMLLLRPIVVNSEMVVLGGNMRLKACREAGLKEIPIIVASDLSEEQQKEFIIKDNVGFGEWDWDALANEWNDFDLINWGLDLPKFEESIIEEQQEEESNAIKISIEATGNAFIEMREKLENLCDEYNAIMKVK